MESLVTKVQNNVVKVRSSVYLTAALEEAILNWNATCRYKRLILSAPTRWNSVFLMFSRFIYLRLPLSSILENRKLKEDYSLSEIDEDEWNLLIEVNNVLIKFFKDSIEMETSKKPTMNSVTLVYTGLYRHCERHYQRMLNDNRCSGICNGIYAAQQYLTKYFNKGSIAHYAAMLFDPRVKNSVYMMLGWIQASDDMNNR